MTLTGRVLATWRNPRAVMRGLLAEGQREDRALAFLMGACFLIFVSRWPLAARAAHLDPSVPLDARLGAELMSALFMVPLAAYLIAALSHLAMRAIGRGGNWFGARLALFWSLLAVAPLMLLLGLVQGMIGPGPQQLFVGIAVFAGFLFLWGGALAEASHRHTNR